MKIKKRREKRKRKKKKLQKKIKKIRKRKKKIKKKKKKKKIKKKIKKRKIKKKKKKKKKEDKEKKDKEKENEKDKKEEKEEKDKKEEDEEEEEEEDIDKILKEEKDEKTKKETTNTTDIKETTNTTDIKEATNKTDIKETKEENKEKEKTNTTETKEDKEEKESKENTNKTDIKDTKEENKEKTKTNNTDIKENKEEKEEKENLNKTDIKETKEENKEKEKTNTTDTKEDKEEKEKETKENTNKTDIKESKEENKEKEKEKEHTNTTDIKEATNKTDIKETKEENKEKEKTNTTETKEDKEEKEKETKENTNKTENKEEKVEKEEKEKTNTTDIKKDKEKEEKESTNKTDTKEDKNETNETTDTKDKTNTTKIKEENEKANTTNIKEEKEKKEEKETVNKTDIKDQKEETNTTNEKEEKKEIKDKKEDSKDEKETKDENKEKNETKVQKEETKDEKETKNDNKEKSEESETKSNTTSISKNENKLNSSESCNGNIGLNPNYKKIDQNDTKYTYIPIVGIDDVHGVFFPKINKIKVDGKTLEYKTGGLEYVARYLNILREDFGPERVLFFDAGDFYQGGIDSVLFDGEIMQDFYNLIGINGTTIGNHEFDYSRKWVEKKIKKGDYPMLIHNIKDNTTNKYKGALGKKHEKSRLYNIKLKNGDTIKIGVIGLSYNMKNDKTMPNTWGNRDSWDKINFYPYIEKLENESNYLRKKGAIAVLALTHFGLACNQTSAMKLDMYNESSTQGQCFRDDEDSVMFKLTDKLKPGIIDGIIGGDTHMEMHHWENGIALMSTPTHARYINIMYLPFKKDENGNYTLVNKEIKIEGPLPACEKIFENYQNCELISSKESEQAGKLINFSWRGKQIETDKSVQKIYDKYYEKFKNYAEQDIVSFEGFGKIKVDKSGDCTLGNTYLDAIVDIKKADFAIINRGIFPEELAPGTLTRAEFYNQMPYLDKICTVKVTGKELKDIVETVQSKGKGFYPSSNLKQTIKIEKDGNKTVTNVEIYKNGNLMKINDEDEYVMASSLFVLSETSGEDFAKGKAFKVIHEKAINKKVTCSNETIDNEMASYFKGKGVIDLSKKVDETRPRIVIEKEN